MSHRLIVTPTPLELAGKVCAVFSHCATPIRGFSHRGPPSKALATAGPPYKALATVGPPYKALATEGPPYKACTKEALDSAGSSGNDDVRRQQKASLILSRYYVPSPGNTAWTMVKGTGLIEGLSHHHSQLTRKTDDAVITLNRSRMPAASQSHLSNVSHLILSTQESGNIITPLTQMRSQG